jgi:hypothetical protein
MRLEQVIGRAAWDLSPAQVRFRAADLDERESNANRMAAYVARNSQADKPRDFQEFVALI